MTNRSHALIFAAVLLLCSAFVQSQVSVAIAPDPHPQFTDGTGKPLAGGFLYTYQAGTTTLLNTYVDAGGIVQNPDPIPLDATGAPSNGSTQTGIWLANTAYKFCAYNFLLVQQWCTDNVTGYLGLLNLPNTWTFQQTFSLPIIDTAIDSQLVLGAPGNQTTLDFPPPTGPITLHFPNTGDTMVGRSTTDTLANKNLTNPLVNNVTVFGPPATYEVFTNDGTTGTAFAHLVKISASPLIVKTLATTDTGGAIGICVLTCGITGASTVAMGGVQPCTFDNSTTAGHYVQISSGTGGLCHDAGATYPTGGGQIVGIAQSNSSAGTIQIAFFGGDIEPTLPLGGSTPTFTGGTGSGTSPSVTCGTSVCLDRGGIVTVLAGTSPATNGAIANIVFGGTYASAYCSISAASFGTSTSTAQPVLYIVPQANQLTIQSGNVALVGGTTYNWTYICNFR